MKGRGVFVTLICGIASVWLSGFAMAQTFPIHGNIGRIGILDQEQLFTQSQAGIGILARYQTAAKELSEENIRLQKQLEEDERALTETRKTMEHDAFNVLAVEFDAKVKKIRAEQANKERLVNRALTDNRAAFFDALTPILQEFIEENGIEIVLNKDTVVLASSDRDITQAAIQRIDEMLKE